MQVQTLPDHIQKTEFPKHAATPGDIFIGEKASSRENKNVRHFCHTFHTRIFHIQEIDKHSYDWRAFYRQGPALAAVDTEDKLRTAITKKHEILAGSALTPKIATPPPLSRRGFRLMTTRPFRVQIAVRQSLPFFRCTDRADMFGRDTASKRQAYVPTSLGQDKDEQVRLAPRHHAGIPLRSGEDLSG